MIRIYLDWNIITSLKNPEGDILVLKRLLDKIRDRVLIPYSDAHLDDLIPKFGESMNLYIERDLDLLSELTANHCLVAYWQKESVVPEITDPRIFYRQRVDNKQGPIVDWPAIKDDFHEFGLDEELKAIENLPLGIDFSEIMQNPEIAKIFQQLFPNSIRDGNYGAMTEDLAARINELALDPQKYKFLRDLVKDNLGLGHEVSNLDEVIISLDEKLPTSPIGKSFTSFSLEAARSSRPNQNATRYSNFISLYTNLDLVGYRPEKITAKNGFSNLINDSRHAFYAGHCDYFITNDNASYHKSKAVFSHLKIETRVMKVAEFIEHQKNWIAPITTPDSFSERLLLICRADTWKTISNDDNDSILNYRQELDTKFLDYFNTCYLSVLPNGCANFHFLWEEVNYSEFIFFAELDSLIGKLIDIFGSDHTGIGKLDENERKATIEKKWPAREWVWENFALTLQIDPIHSLILTVYINEPKNESPTTT